MSSSDSTLTSSSSSPQPTSQSSGPFGQPASSSLYLFTFLSTLLLLLIISCAIMIRSAVLRRRFRRRVQEALAVGAILTPRSPGSRRKRFGQKPKLHDVWLSPGGENWTDIMPVSALPVFSKRKTKDSNTGQSQERGSLARRLFRFPRTSNSTPEQPHSSPLKVDVRPLKQKMQISVLIAMPSAETTKYSLEDDEGDHIPNVVVGVTQLPYRAESRGTSEEPIDPEDTYFARIRN